MRAPHHVETALEQRKVGLVVLDGEVVVPAPVRVELRAEEMPPPVGLQANVRGKLERVVGARDWRAEHVVGQNGADLRLGEQKEATDARPDRHVGIELVPLRRQRQVFQIVFDTWRLEQWLAGGVRDPGPRDSGNRCRGLIADPAERRRWLRLGGQQRGILGEIVGEGRVGPRTPGPGLRAGGLAAVLQRLKRLRRVIGLLHADAPAQDGRILRGGRREHRDKQGGSERARCAGRMATRQGRTSIDSGRKGRKSSKSWTRTQTRGVQSLGGIRLTRRLAACRNGPFLTLSCRNPC